MQRLWTAYIGSGLVLVAAITGCASDPKPGTGTDNLTCELAAPLTCTSTTLCSNSTVKVFHGALPAPAGGAIPVGTYRLGYVLHPDGQAGATGTEAADELTFGARDFLHVSADPSTALPGGLGSYTSAGSSLTLSFTTGCSGNGIPSSAFDDCGPRRAVAMTSVSATVGYTMDHDTLSIFRDAPGGPAMYVYYTVLNINGDAASACPSVGADPATPGDSLACRATGFCACIHHEDIEFDCSSSN